MNENLKYQYTPLPQPIPITEQVWPEGTLPIVTTRTMTYMHESFIRECIEGILMQKTTFPVQVLIHDDASTDATANIVREYELKYPKVIKAYYQIENSYTKADKRERRAEFMSWVRGKYIGLCEGDDYWTDPLKLQKQVDFLEGNSEFSICFHRFKYDFQDNRQFVNDSLEDIFSDNKYFFSFNVIEYFSRWMTQTCTVLIRSNCIDFEFLGKLKHTFDVILFYSILKKGKGALLGFEGAIYRKHNQGIYTGIDTISYCKLHYEAFKDLFGIDNSPIIKDVYLYNIKTYLKNYIMVSKKLDFNLIYDLIKDIFELHSNFNSIRSTGLLIVKSFIRRLIKK
jgi:glycosyltransferase involved in cell wall biosynthesis